VSLEVVEGGVGEAISQNLDDFVPDGGFGFGCD